MRLYLSCGMSPPPRQKKGKKTTSHSFFCVEIISSMSRALHTLRAVDIDHPPPTVSSTPCAATKPSRKGSATPTLAQVMRSWSSGNVRLFVVRPHVADVVVDDRRSHFDYDDESDDVRRICTAIARDFRTALKRNVYFDIVDGRATFVP